MYSLIMGYVPKPVQKQIVLQFEQEVKNKGANEIDEEYLVKMFEKFLPQNFLPLFRSMVKLVKIKGK